MSAPIEKFLEPGEEVRFEAHAQGWPPLTGPTFALYATVLAFAAFIELGSGSLPPVAVGKYSVPMPIFAPALGLIFIFELYRTAEFRSRVYVITNERLFALHGVFRTKLWYSVATTKVRSVQLWMGAPAVVTAGSKQLLEGLDSVDLESMATLFGGVPVLTARSPSLWKRRGKAIALVLAVLFIGASEVEAQIQARGAAEFQRIWTTIPATVAAQKAHLDAQLEKDGFLSGGGMGSGCGWSNLSGHGSLNMSVESTKRFQPGMDMESRDELKIDIEIFCDRDFSLLPRGTVVVVKDRAQTPESKAFLDTVVKALKDAGIEVVR